MFSDIELENYFDSLGMPESGRRLIRTARLKAPIRNVQSNSGNVVVHHQSLKMQRTLLCESWRVEFPFVFLNDHNPEVIELYLQPCHLDIIQKGKDGEKVGRFQHIPDCLILAQDGVSLEEYKRSDKLESLHRRYPNRYIREQDGTWRNPHVEEFVLALGIKYRIRTTEEISQIYLENLLFLRNYFEPSAKPLLPEKNALLQQCFSQYPAIYLNDALSSGIGITADDIFQAIVEGYVFADLENERLAEPYRARIYRDRATIEFLNAARECALESDFTSQVATVRVGARLIFNGAHYEVTMVGDTDVAITGGNGTTRAIKLASIVDLLKTGHLVIESQPTDDTYGAVLSSMASYTDEDLEEAIWRRDVLLGRVVPNEPIPKRTMQEWKKKYESAPEGSTSSILALISNKSRRGNRKSKIPEEVSRILDHVIDDVLYSPSNPTRRFCYLMVCDLCHKAGFVPPSYKTFWLRTKRRESDAAIRSKCGKRIAHAKSEFTYYLEYTVPVHGVRPWEVVHIDHTELDIELIDYETRKCLKRPWLSLALDARTRRIVGFYLSFDPPSYRSCMMVLRDIVRRWGRLPDWYVVDNGKEFHSISFRILASLYLSDIRYRPSGKPRFGSVMERVFGVSNTDFIHNLAGNTQVMQQVRTVTRSVNPKNLAEWTLEFLYFAFDYWVYEVYDLKEHPALHVSPRAAFDEGMRTAGARSHKLIPYNSDFRIQTCPSVSSGKRTIRRNRGLNIYGDYYYCDEFKNPSTWDKKVPVKVDPWDTSVCYAYVNNKWQQCISKTFSRYRSLTFMELRAASEEATCKCRSKKRPTPEEVVAHLYVCDPSNFQNVQAMCQTSMKRLYNPLHIGCVDEANFVQPSVLENGISRSNNLVQPTASDENLEIVEERSPVERSRNTGGGLYEFF